MHGWIDVQKRERYLGGGIQIIQRGRVYFLVEENDVQRFLNGEGIYSVHFHSRNVVFIKLGDFANPNRLADLIKKL